MKIENKDLNFTALGSQTDFSSRVKTVEKTAVKQQKQAANIAIDSKNTEKTDKAEQNKLDAISQRLVGADTSLIIEKDPESTGFIYKSINKNTGDIVKIWPQTEFVGKLASLQDVDAKGLIYNSNA